MVISVFQSQWSNRKQQMRQVYSKAREGLAEWGTTRYRTTDKIINPRGGSLSAVLGSRTESGSLSAPGWLVIFPPVRVLWLLFLRLSVMPHSLDIEIRKERISYFLQIRSAWERPLLFILSLFLIYIYIYLCYCYKQFLLYFLSSCPVNIVEDHYWACRCRTV